MSKKTPALFVGHGSPMNALSDNRFTRDWRDIGARIGRPRIVLCVSAHWETEFTRVTSNERPKTIHDFYGFPPALFAMEYNAPGAPEFAERLGKEIGADIRPDPTWGLDHGAWSVLKFLYPDADIPVVQLSLDTRKTGAEHYALGRALSALREQGVLILGSGNVVHNLRHFNRHDETPLDWASAFNERVKDRIRASDHEALIDYPSLKDSALAIQGPEHYLPLVYVLGAAGADEKPEILTDAVQSSIAMTSVAFGL